MDRIIVINRNGPHHVFGVGRVLANWRAHFTQSLSEMYRFFEENPDEQEVHLLLCEGTEHQEVYLMEGEKPLCLILQDNALPDETTLRAKLVRTMRFMNRPLTPEDPEFFVPTLAANIGA